MTLCSFFIPVPAAGDFRERREWRMLFYGKEAC